MPVSALMDYAQLVIAFMHGAFLQSIPVFVVTAIGIKVFEHLAKKHGWKFLKALTGATFVIWLIIIAAVFLYPSLVAKPTGSIGKIPEPYAQPLADFLSETAGLIVRFVLLAAVFSVIVMPLEFFGLYIFETLGKRWPKLGFWPKVYVSVYVCTLIALFVALLVFPWLLPAALFMIFFGFG